jgi:hypothetical protein
VAEHRQFAAVSTAQPEGGSSLGLVISAFGSVACLAFAFAGAGVAAAASVNSMRMKLLARPQTLHWMWP